ncbi:unnamed protein product [Rangifer tarandus platyrhynchus]|uniref:Uncharacterized protein n=2 Tax=Rangifer tarandus platyrhynchus TaxID=3082113 RepID=A0ACB0EW84_RANTA|nr:unnamed protein product [Rangifer tarandus platyrhynchus]CAI9704709.1 unnamed protein product [Rangifer tarandus platyrhynchus]
MEEQRGARGGWRQHWRGPRDHRKRRVEKPPTATSEYPNHEGRRHGLLTVTERKGLEVQRAGARDLRLGSWLKHPGGF